MMMLMLMFNLCTFLTGHGTDCIKVRMMFNVVEMVTCCVGRATFSCVGRHELPPIPCLACFLFDTGEMIGCPTELGMQILANDFMIWIVTVRVYYLWINVLNNLCYSS